VSRAAFLHIRRTPTPGTWVRCVTAPPGTTPGEFALECRETIAWSLTSAGQPVKYWYVRVDDEKDGCGEFTIDPMFPSATAYESDNISLVACYRPIRDREVSGAAKIEESYHRRAARLHWCAYHAEQDRKREEQRAADKVRIKAEQAVWVAQQEALAGIIVKPKAKPKTWLQRLIG
jgi:hypothetical protein